MSRFPHVPREAVIKEDLLRGWLAFDDSALTGNENGDVKPKSYFIFSFDHRTLPELGTAALRRSPEEIVLTDGPYELRFGQLVYGHLAHCAIVMAPHVRFDPERSGGQR
ncbi:MAG TPA: hypothetical protein VFX61_05890 [Micromonosporaceae bacterium]|nr:hypothetical protein [Micromonosporaceae bacterium]